MKLLVVKTSSMGDVVHAMPALEDIVSAHPGVVVDWVVEPAFAAIVRLHPAVRRVLPMAWRRWRKHLGQRPTWREMAAFRATLQAEPYDLVLDLQGLLKSALVGRLARGPLAGYDRASMREPMASWLYARRAAVDRGLHAVERCRRLAAAHLGHPLPPGPARFGLSAPTAGWLPTAPWAVLIPNASRPEKFWPETDWIAVGRRLRERGWTPVVLWGSPSEQAMASRIAAGCDGVVPPFLGVGDMAAVLAGAAAVVGLDTGFTHLAAAFGRPTLGIYCDHEPGLAGVTGPGAVASIGGKGHRPGLTEVLQLAERGWPAASAQ